MTCLRCEEHCSEPAGPKVIDGYNVPTLDKLLGHLKELDEALRLVSITAGRLQEVLRLQAPDDEEVLRRAHRLEAVADGASTTKREWSDRHSDLYFYER